jgi:hypothetical protein
MTYAPRPNEFVPYFDARPARRLAVPRRRLLRRVLAALFPSREQEAEQEAARCIARSGDRFTDEIERQITDRLITGKWWR